MSQQPFPPQQATYPSIRIQGADDVNVSQATEGYYSFFYGCIPLPVSSHPQGALDPVIAHQHQGQLRVGVGHYHSHLQDPRRPIVLPLQPPTPSLPIPIPTQTRYPTIDSPPSPSPSTPGSTSSSTSGTSPDVCRQSKPLFDQQTNQWCCGGCNRTFSDKYGAQRHIRSVGAKVTCRYCGSRISALESSRRRHLRRESCKKSTCDRGITRNEQDAFIEDA